MLKGMAVSLLDEKGLNPVFYEVKGVRASKALAGACSEKDRRSKHPSPM